MWKSLVLSNATFLQIRRLSPDLLLISKKCENLKTEMRWDQTGLKFPFQSAEVNSESEVSDFLTLEQPFRSGNFSIDFKWTLKFSHFYMYPLTGFCFFIFIFKITRFKLYLQRLKKISCDLRKFYNNKFYNLCLKVIKILSCFESMLTKNRPWISVNNY